ncbi:VOC family protein [Pseudactinotalea sp.]|uniref:VOC family protein n=1 Tax=Pseudactinotalea sp. TaxID=1926260 RepID=UPI003B3B7A4E
MFHGPATVNIYAADMPAAIAWYTELFELEPYFRRPEEGPVAYAEWRIGDLETEVGVIDAAWAPYPVGTAAGAVLHWSVDDVESAHARLLALGATTLEGPTVRGEGFVTASVTDPFGNVLGVMENAHYREQRARLVN